MKKPNSCRECPGCKIGKKKIVCKSCRTEATGYYEEMNMYRKCLLDWEN